MHADTLVGICVPRSLNMIIGILGILKAGAAYVPLDPEYPEERLKYILEDCQPLLIITEEDIVAKYAFISKLYSNKLLVLDDIKIKKQLAECDSVNLKKISGPNCLAYLIYTSGSTGKPKGVLVEQRGVVNYIYNQTEYLKLQQPKSFYFIHSYAFDTSISSIFGSLQILKVMKVFQCHEKPKKKCFAHFNNNWG
ncbi:AMP-binding protein [Legionella cincinnatiensis]|uniref:AMP-binding protein n=1 Tax=Legionella cincinnatiensis TaxID=28085 RepID=UPI002377E65C|nr:AMP-binding protein [Legionella cincinnatiensis]